MTISIKSQLYESLERPWLGGRYAAVACLAYPASPITTSTGHIHILCLSRLTHLQPLSHASPSRLESGPRQEKKRWHGYGYLFSALFRLRLLHNNARISCGPCLYPHSAFDPTEEKPTLTRLVSFLSRASLVLVGPGMFGYRHCIPDMNRPVLGFFSASNQTDNDATGRCCRHTKTFWLLFHFDILLFLTFLGLVLLFSLPLFGIISGYPGFRRFWHKNGGTHEWSPYISLFCFCCFLFSLPLPRITLSTFCNGMRYACISMYSYCWYIDEWLDGRTSYIPRGRIMFY